ncbi:MAG: V-type ATPase subunit [Candidatus Peregrinibacteria bacterium]|nr:V-type ATPase subunit [Candidatus Peregrinibacteria bacterium]
MFLNGRIRALESKLLDVGRLDRMIGAKNAEDAFRVLVELQYSEYLNESTRAESFNEIIDRGLSETKKMISESDKDFAGFQFLWAKYDANNLKRAAKIKLIEGKDKIEDFSDENGFSLLGDISQEEVENAIFEGKISENIPNEFVKALRSIESIYEKTQSFRDVEFAIDTALYDYLARIASKSYSSYLKDLFRFTVNSLNLQAIARSVLVFDEKLPKNAFIHHGDFHFSDIEKIESFEDFTNFVKITDFSSVLDNIKENDSDEDKVLKIGKEIDSLYKNFTHDSAEGEISSPQIPINYFERRVQNARMIKFVMFAKFHGMSPEKIYKTLERF